MMTVVDRLLVALTKYIELEVGLNYEVRLRDWEGTKSARELIADADEPEEHQTLRGCFRVRGMLALRVHPRDETADARRDALGAIAAALADENAIVWLSNSANERGLEAGEELRVFDLRTDDGHWELDDERLVGKVQFRAMIAAVAG